MGDNDVWQGTLALMILKTLESMGPLDGYGIARRSEQISQDQWMSNKAPSIQHGGSWSRRLHLLRLGCPGQ